MPLTLFPVPFRSDPNPKDKEQKPIVPAPTTRRAVTLKLPIEVARALKDATANAKQGGQPAVRVTLNGDKPGLSIAGQLFPFDLALKPTNDPSNVAELYSRTRLQYPRKPADHRPPLALQSVIVGHAVVEDAAQKLRDRTAEVGQAKKERRIQMLETPPATTSGAGAKASATGGKKKKNAAARTATASTLERDVLRKGVAMKATTGAPAASSSMSAPASNRASPSTINHKQTPGSSSSTPTSPATSPLDTRPLEERIIHLLATKSQTVRDLEGLPGANKDNISEILRRVATTFDPSSSSANSTSIPKGHWALKPTTYASVHPWTWPAYTDHDRQRIAVCAEKAFDQQGLSREAPEWLKLKEGEARWRKKMAARSASGTPVPGTTQRKVKMNKISEPPNATGGTLSASSVKPGMVKATSANGISTTSTKKKAARVDGTGSTRDSDLEMKEKPRKRPSPTESSRSGAATPMSASSSNGSTSSGTSASAPLRHGLPSKPQANLGPPPSGAQHAGHSSHTPPPPRPSATPTQSPRPAGSAASPKAKVTSATSKRKHDDMSDLDDALMTGKAKGSRSNLGASSSSNSIPQEAKRRKLEPSPLGAGSSTAASSRTGSTSSIAVANGTVVKTKREAVMRDDSGSTSSNQAQQSLKPPPTQANGRAPSAALRSASTTTTKSDRETSQRPKVGRKEPSPLGPSALSRSVNGKEKSSTSAKAEERRTSGKGRSMPVFTSSEEEEDPEAVAAEAARRAAAKKKKLALNAAAASSPAPVASNAPRLRKVKPLPTPLPTDRQELRLLHGDKYPEMLASYAELQAESAKMERCAVEQGDPSTLWPENDFRAKINEYTTLHGQVQVLRAAVDASLRAEGQD